MGTGAVEKDMLPILDIISITQPEVTGGGVTFVILNRRTYALSNKLARQLVDSA